MSIKNLPIEKVIIENLTEELSPDTSITIKDNEFVKTPTILSEQTDHLRAIKPIREAPYAEEDTYIKGADTAETNIEQFAVEDVTNRLFISSIFIKLTGTVISFNINNVLGSRSVPITTDVFAFSTSEAIEENKCIVYSARGTKPTILDNAIVLEKGDTYDTTGEVNRITFEFIDDELIIATNTVLAASVIEVAPIYVDNGTQTSYDNGTFTHTLDYTLALEGDMMIASFSRRAGADNPITPPAGWDTLVDVTNMMTVFARKRMSGDGDSYAFTQASNQSRGVVMPILRNVDYTNGSTATLTIGTPLVPATGTVSNISEITTTKLGLVLAFAVAGSGTPPIEITWQSGWTVEQTRLEIFNTQRLSSVASKELNGASGTVEYTLNQSLINTGVLISFYTA